MSDSTHARLNLAWKKADRNDSSAKSSLDNKCDSGIINISAGLVPSVPVLLLDGFSL